MGKKLDELDKRILSELAGNAKIPARNLAEKMKIHPNTLLMRLKRLEKCGIITGYCAELDYGVLGYDMQVVIMMKVGDTLSEDMRQLDSILCMSELEAFYATTGDWDVLSLWRVKDKAHLNEIIRKVVNHPSITGTLSHIVLHTYKNPLRFNPFGNSR